MEKIRRGGSLVMEKRREGERRHSDGEEDKKVRAVKENSREEERGGAVRRGEGECSDGEEEEKG
eukprot:2293182-Rhodomonas_salina.1